MSARRQRSHAFSLRPGAAGRLRRDALVFAVILLAYLAIGSQVQNSYYQLMFTLIPLWAMIGLSWNLFSGYSGLTSFGHAVFVGVGAYAVAIGSAQFGISPWLTIPLGGCLGAVAAVLIGLPTLRLRGHYFALSMLAYPLVMLYLLQYLGYQEVPLPMHRDNPVAWLQFADRRLEMLVASGLLVVAMIVSMSGALAAAAGGFYANVLLVVTPDSVFGMLTSAQALVVALFGGVGTYWGPLIGAAVLIPLSETLQANFGDRFPGIEGVVYGTAIIAVMLLAPEGVFWTLRDRLQRARKTTRQFDLPAPTRALVDPSWNQAQGTLLEVDNLCKAFGGLRAVDGVSIKVAPGQILGIIGPNGAGKTTLFNVINGVLPPSSGSVTLAGERLHGRPLWAIARAGVGRTFQVVRSFPRLPLLENVIVGAYGAGLAGAEAIEMATLALERTGLRELAMTPAGSLTNKQLRLMELARALSGRPRILLLDETLAGLGHEECDDVLDVLQKLRADGMTIVIIEHTMRAMLRIADEFLVIDHGRALARGTPRDVLADQRVIEAYLGRKWASSAPC